MRAIMYGLSLYQALHVLPPSNLQSRYYHLILQIFRESELTKPADDGNRILALEPQILNMRL